MTNRLADATSPYLQQHATNPVDWWPWCDEAFAEAVRRDVPVFLSIGYAACHWCHVMAHESFEDGAIAAQLNDGFVSIKVDREERPDLDALYMAATQGLSGQGGWPMTVFLDSQRRPFYAGTYFPPQARHGLPSFSQLLTGISEAWTSRRSDVDATATQVLKAIDSRQFALAGHIDDASRRDELAVACDVAVEELTRAFDATNGGFGAAPKFPPSTVLEFLLRHGLRTGDEIAIEMVGQTCEAMARGGLYDQLGGGFARYCVDETWSVPHFEKMLYDNALLLRLYAHLFAVTGSQLARRVCEETADFVLRDLVTDEGGFASSLDADAPRSSETDLAEGASYVWTMQELIDVLGEEDGSRAAAFLSVTPRGNFELEYSVLHQVRDPHLSKATAGVAHPARWWARTRARLFAARNTRPQPRRDDKVVAAWNGLMISALVDAGRLLDRQDWIDAALTAAEHLLAVHVRGAGSRTRLARTSRAGVTGSNDGVLEDYACLADGFMSLFLATGDEQWLAPTGELAEVIVAEFFKPADGFADTGTFAEQLIARPSDPFEQATPSGWSAATNALLTYGTLMARSDVLAVAECGLDLAVQAAPQSARFLGGLFGAAEAYLDGPTEVVIVEPRGRRSELARVALAAARPTALVVVGEQVPSRLGPLGNRGMVDGQPTAYVCRGTLCYEPVTSPDSLIALLGPSD